MTPFNLALQTNNAQPKSIEEYIDIENIRKWKFHHWFQFVW
jgi:hypothetical protein